MAGSRTKLKLWCESVRRMIRNSYDECHEMPLPDRFIGLFLGAFVVFIFMIFAPILFLMVPIWGIPYLIIKHFRGGK